ncbi:hypothetical protein GWK47_054148 [Chionoecetes opilio]|uniref:Uncharacterized protein n=1 Tax=Chionoecetes opilio TaxID=41210 RepID=A0A8J4Y4R3_CHIOP|nr:hypothetical protein GWK47_054148 [Chionoecetes opilio]
MSMTSRSPTSWSRWLTTAQSLVLHVDQKAGLTGKELNTLEIIVKYCLQVYFKLYYPQGSPQTRGRPKAHPHAAQSDERAQPKKGQTAVTFYGGQEHVRTLRMWASSRDGESSHQLADTISWQPGPVHEPAFTCSLSGDQIQESWSNRTRFRSSLSTLPSTERVGEAGDRGCGKQWWGSRPETGSSGLGPTTGRPCPASGLRRT